MKKPSKKDLGSLLQNNSTSREAILSAALKAFARDGYNGASMPTIAKMAQVAPPLIHYYFGSKENLWRETIDYSLGDLRRDALAIGQATRALAPLDRLRALLQTLAQHAARWPDQFVMIIAEARSESDRFAWVQENYTGIIFQEVQHTLQDAKDRRLIRDISIDQIAVVLIGGILTYFTLTPEILKDASPERLDKVSSEYTDLMFEMLLHGISTSADDDQRLMRPASRAASRK